MTPKRLLAIFLLLITGVIYGMTLAPGLTWANQGMDGGDLITAAATGGIAHPSGYPLYLIIARVFQLLPFIDLALRTNLMSAIFASLAVLLAYELLARQTQGSLFAAFFGALSFGLSPLFWSQAVITEVYTLHLFFMALLSVLFVFFHKRKKLQGFLAGLAIGNHLTALIFLPLLLVSQNWKKKQVWKDISAQIVFFFLGASFYVLLPLRAFKHPVLNWENPITWQNFWYLVSGRMYRFTYLESGLSTLSKLTQGAALFLEQFGFIGLMVGFFGLIFFMSKSRFYALTLWLALASWGIFLLYQAPAAEFYLLPFFFAFSLWLGVGLNAAIVFLRAKHRMLPNLLLLLVAVTLIWRTSRNWQRVDASRDTRAEDFLAEVLTSAPHDAILVTEGDAAIFALWYGYYALGQRPDLVVLAKELLGYDWYQETIRKYYPSLNLPPYFPWASVVFESNPQRPHCQVADLSGELSCYVIGQ